MRVLQLAVLPALVVALVVGVAAWRGAHLRRADALERWGEQELIAPGSSVPPDSGLVTRSSEPRAPVLAPQLWVRREGLEVWDGGLVAIAALRSPAGREHVTQQLEDSVAHAARVASYGLTATGPPLLLIERRASLGTVRVALDVLRAARQSEVVVAFLVPSFGWMLEAEQSDAYRRYMALPSPRAVGVDALVRATQPLCPPMWRVFENWPTCPPDRKTQVGVYLTAEAARSWLCVVDHDALQGLLWAMVGERPLGGPEVNVTSLRRALRAFPSSALWYEVLQTEGDDGEAAGRDDAAGHGVGPTFQWPER